MPEPQPATASFCTRAWRKGSMKSALGASALLPLLLAGIAWRPTPRLQRRQARGRGRGSGRGRGRGATHNALGERVTYYAGIY